MRKIHIETPKDCHEVACQCHVCCPILDSTAILYMCRRCLRMVAGGSLLLAKIRLCERCEPLEVADQRRAVIKVFAHKRACIEERAMGVRGGAGRDEAEVAGSASRPVRALLLVLAVVVGVALLAAVL